MYIAIYVVAILVFCGVLLLVFWKKQKNEKKRLVKLKQETMPPVVLEKKEEEVKQVTQEAVVKKENVTDLAEFEDFSLDGEKEIKKGNKLFATTRKPAFDKLFDFDEEEKDDADVLSEDEIARYEKTLRDSLKFDMNEELEKFNKRHSSFNEEMASKARPFGERNAFDLDDEFDKMGGFEFDKFRQKPKTDIEQMINNLDPKLQEVVMSDVLAKKNFDE